MFDDWFRKKKILKRSGMMECVLLYSLFKSDVLMSLPVHPVGLGEGPGQAERETR